MNILIHLRLLLLSIAVSGFLLACTAESPESSADTTENVEETAAGEASAPAPVAPAEQDVAKLSSDSSGTATAPSTIPQSTTAYAVTAASTDAVTDTVPAAETPTADVTAAGTADTSADTTIASSNTPVDTSTPTSAEAAATAASLEQVALSETPEVRALANADRQASSTPQVPEQANSSSDDRDTAQFDGLRVFKSPTCGCCGDWVQHLEQKGLHTRTQNMADMDSLKDQLGINPTLRSCHTALSPQGYVFEGHVPARYVEQFLAAPPAGAMGLSVPGMPVGSPGMEMGNDFTPYQVIQMNLDGSHQLYAEVKSPADQ